ncbi:DUF6538 domain-containing protein [Agrobacterium radiobacter]|uniref:DUF6538 domain-containing protein n=1 Tax=Agrobacterium radiobacter TaxID=362 RepID=UPI003F85B551
MPAPVLIGTTYYLRVRVPADMKEVAQGKTVSLPIGSRIRQVRVTDFVKASLGTRDPKEAKRLFTPAYAAVVEFWQMLKDGPKPLSHKQVLALAGEIRAAFVSAFDENPETPELWQNVLDVNRRAQSARLSDWPIIPTLEQQKVDLETRFGPLTDAILQHRGVLLEDKNRPRLLQMVAESLNEAATVNLAKAAGDYSDSGETTKYPAFEQKKEAKPNLSTESATFDSVITKEAERRAAGKTAVPLRGATERKYRTATEEFALFRKNKEVEGITAREADAWLQSLLEAGELTNNTIKQRLQNLRTVVEWAREQSLGGLFPHGNPLDLVKPPSHQSVPSAERAYTLEEARTVLKAARMERAPELRWLPWLCAYSGARIQEVAQLTPADFFQVERLWFFRLTTMGGKTLKTNSSERRVPVHPDLVKEGLLDFINTFPGNSPRRIFRPRSQPLISEWLRGKLQITRAELRPNHGWRHLFEDLCLVGGVLDSAKNYITGRATGASGEGYGKSEAMLPGLAREMAKVPSYIK